MSKPRITVAPGYRSAPGTAVRPPGPTGTSAAPFDVRAGPGSLLSWPENSLGQRSRRALRAGTSDTFERLIMDVGDTR